MSAGDDSIPSQRQKLAYSLGNLSVHTICTREEEKEKKEGKSKHAYRLTGQATATVGSPTYPLVAVTVTAIN